MVLLLAMVAHSDYNDRLLVQQQSLPSIDPKRQDHGTTPSFVTSPVPARKRSTNNHITRRTHHYYPVPSTIGADPNRSFLTPGRYYDSYGEWHHHGGGDDGSHWPTQPQQHGPSQQYYYNHGSSNGDWVWNPHNHHHQHHQHHGNALAGILDSTVLYPPLHGQQQQGLLGLQLFVLLHPVLMLGAMSFLVCLVNAVVGLLDKVKLPLVRAQDVDRIAAGSSISTPAGLRDGRDEQRILDQLYQFLNVALDQQQQQHHHQSNESYALDRT
uniref:Uncharacterized protein n=1 Tax=Anopheles christyi TaxID=43041 RepID=A0A182KEN4_9DIPT